MRPLIKAQLYWAWLSGQPAIEAAARTGDPSAVRLPYPRKGDQSFSFSGLKTAVAQRWAQAVAGNENVNDFAASLQQAISVSLCDRVKQALVHFAEAHNEHRLVIAGGVAANQKSEQP